MSATPHLLVALLAIHVPWKTSSPGAPSPTLLATPGGAEVIELLRDPYGVPHVFAPSDEGAYYGLGYACAEDRIFQMAANRFAIYGRMAEFFGRGMISAKHPDGVYLSWDIRMRLFGYWRIAQRIVDAMDIETHAMLQAYSDGVNAYVDTLTDPITPPAYFTPYFDETEWLADWTPTDCVATWLRIARGYTNAEPIQDVFTRHRWDCCTTLNTERTCSKLLQPVRVIDEGGVVIKESDVFRTDFNDAFDWIASLGGSGTAGGAAIGGNTGADLQPLHGFPMVGGEAINDEDTAQPGFSHAWAVTGNSTRPAVLVGMPQIPVTTPSGFWEGHMKGETIEVRGVTVPGSPNFLIGSTPKMAWSITAMSADQADCYELVVNDDLDEYFLDGAFRPFEFDDPLVSVLIAGEPSITVHYRETVWGPVITETKGDKRFFPDHIGDVPCDSPTDYSIEPDEMFSVRWVPYHLSDPGYVSKLPPPETREPGSEAGFLMMYRADGPNAFRKALCQWTAPVVGCVFAEADPGKRVGYAVVGALPLRDSGQLLGGLMAHDGTDSANAWRTEDYPCQLRPWVQKGPPVNDDEIDFLVTGNNAAIGKAYPLPLVQNGGFTERARRATEILEALDPNDFASDALFLEAIRNSFRDTVQPTGRDLVLLGLYLRTSGQKDFKQKADNVLDRLEDWATTREGRLSAETVGEAADSFLAARTDLIFRPNRCQECIPKRKGKIAAGLTSLFGESNSAANFFLRQKVADKDLGLLFTAEEKAVIEVALLQSWKRALADEPIEALWDERYIESLTIDVALGADLEWLLGGLKDADHVGSYSVGPLTVTSKQTLLSQSAQIYTQFVTMDGVTAAESLLPIGQSEDATACNYDSQRPLWETWDSGAGTWDPVELKPSPFDKVEIMAMTGPCPPSMTTLIRP